MRVIKRRSKVSNIYRVKSLKANTIFRCESLGEVCQVLLNELNDEVISQCAQPFTIKYLFNDEIRHYTPDLLVKMKSGEWLIIEVKPANRLKPFSEKFEVIKKLLQKKGMKFVVNSDESLFHYETLFKLNRMYIEKFYA